MSEDNAGVAGGGFSRAAASVKCAALMSRSVDCSAGIERQVDLVNCSLDSLMRMAMAGGRAGHRAEAVLNQLQLHSGVSHHAVSRVSRQLCSVTSHPREPLGRCAKMVQCRANVLRCQITMAAVIVL
jgi:hypothetical protein